MTELLEVGRVSKPHGIRGELRIIPTALSAQRLAACQRLCFRREGEDLCFEPEMIRVHQGRVIVKAPQIGDRNAAETWRDAWVMVAKDDCPPADAQDLDLLDIQGFGVQTPDGEMVGTVTDLLTLPGQRCLVMDREGREVLIPWVEAFIASVDPDRGVVTINPIEGLLDTDAN